MDWHPIETAPHDEFVFLLGGKPDENCDWADNKGYPPVVVGRYHGPEKIYDRELEVLIETQAWRWASYDSGFYGYWYSPTHWASLPTNLG